MNDPFPISSLMSTIAQTAATFVAILAGFYTTKIISIAGDKNRIENKIQEINLEIVLTKKNIEIIENELDEIINRNDESLVDSFIEYVIDEIRSSLFYNDIPDYTFDNLKEEFIKYYDDNITENQAKKLNEKMPLIMEEIKNKKEEKRSEYEKSTIPAEYITTSIGRPISESESIIRYHKNENENRIFEAHIQNKNNEENKLSFLKERLRIYEQELKSLIYPKHLKFAYISFIIFAIFGVIIPLTYEWWNIYFGEYSDIFALSMFGAGLMLSFVYIYMEMHDTTKK